MKSKLEKSIADIEEDAEQLGILNPAFLKNVNLDTEDHWPTVEEVHAKTEVPAETRKPRTPRPKPAPRPAPKEVEAPKPKVFKRRRKREPFALIDIPEEDYQLVYGGLYIITRGGRFLKVRETPEGLEGRPSSTYIEKRTGHVTASISIEGKRIAVKIYKLVARAFNPNPKGLKSVLFKDGDRSHNWSANLEWHILVRVRGDFKRRFQEVPQNIIDTILDLYDAGMTRKNIAESVEVRYNTVAGIVRRSLEV